MIKVLVVDDSLLVQKVIIAILETDPLIKIVGVASNGEEALSKIVSLTPDVVTLDIDMPKLSGIDVLKKLSSINDVKSEIIVLSYLSTEGAELTLSALDLGAFDYIPKPDGKSISFHLDKIKKELLRKIKAAYLYKGNRRAHKKKELILKDNKFNIDKTQLKLDKAVVIGISTGGPVTIKEVVSNLIIDNYALFVVQHIPEAFSPLYAQRIDSISQLDIIQARDGGKVTPGMGYVAKGGHQMIIQKNKNHNIVTRISKNPETIYTPNIDLTLESVLSVFGKNTIGVIMTGLGDDGSKAMKKLKKAGGVTIAELPDTAIAYSMPKEAIRKGGANIIVPSSEIADKIMKAVNKN